MALAASFAGPWPPSGRGVLLVIAAVALAGGVVHFLVDEAMPPWGLQVSATAAVVMVSAAAAVTGRRIDLAVLYVWVVVYAGIFFSPIATAAYVAAVGVAYALVLGLGTGVANSPAAWLVIFATTTLAGVVVAALVRALRQDAGEDSLTGLANRRSWDQRLEKEVERARRSGMQLSVAMVDLDDFKAVNDALGHEAGNAVLRELAGAWQMAVRGSGDLVARLSGDELAVLAPGSDATGIRRLVRRLAEVAPEGVRYSIGTATWEEGESAGDLLHRADQAMYRAKLRRRSPPRTRQSHPH